MKHPLYIVGLYPGSLEPPVAASGIISGADVLSGGKRLLESFPEFSGEVLPFVSPLSDYARELQKRIDAGKRVVLLADGDPCMFGVGRSLLPLMGADNVRIIPSPSAVQIGASRLGLSQGELEILSLHGRSDFSPLYAALQRGRDCAIYTDRVNDPESIACRLLEKGVDNYSMSVLEELGTDSEKITRGTLESFSGFRCADLNIVILTRTGDDGPLRLFGREEESFVRSNGLITKLPARATGLALMDLRRGQTVWDLGAGCGSVSVEGSFLAGDSRFFAVEKDPGRIEMIRENIGRFRAWTVEPVSGTMPDVLKGLPDPDRIFMGGGIGRDDSVIREASRRLKPGGRMVVHAILMGSIQRTRDTFDSLGWDWQAVQLQSSVSESLVGDIRFRAHNPVTVIWADKPAGS